MLWLLLSLLSAASESAKDAFSKKSLKRLDEYTAAWALRFFSFAFIIPVLIVAKIPHIGSGFWAALLVSGILNLATTILYMKAIKSSDLSLAVPMIAFTPLFLLITSPLMLGEFPTTLGIGGVALIVAGSYILNASERSKGLFAPFKALLREKGPRLMLGVALIWSITSNIDKIGVQNSSPIFWAAAMNGSLAVILIPIALYKAGKAPKLKTAGLTANLKSLAPIGLFGAFMHIFQFTAISMAFVAYVNAIKRTSILMSVLTGHFLFSEKRALERLTGAAIMVAGVIMIAVS
ncbi:EamA family transporter [Candidatus Woesearchaeota archaeon]|nr:EamA family transporter [Candidatus Woesearchaeota archaeon]